MGMGEESEVKGGEEKRKGERERELSITPCGGSGNYIDFSHRIWPMHFAITK